MSEHKKYRIHVSVTHEVNEDVLKALWRFYRGTETFSVRRACALVRRVFSDNPEVETQIHEGRKLLKFDEIRVDV